MASSLRRPSFSSDLPAPDKTHFVKTIAGMLPWWYIDILPGMFMADGVERLGADLHAMMEKARTLLFSERRRPRS